MPAFRERNTGQVVTHDDDALVARFRSWARWEEVAEEPKKTSNRRTTSNKKAEPKAEAPASTKAPAEDAATK